MATLDSKTGGRAATGAVVPGRFALSIGRTSLPEPPGFKWRALGDLARLESGHTPSRNRPEYWDGGIPWVGIRDATANHGRVIADTNQHVSEAGLLNSSARLLPAGTVCLSRTASVGYVVVMGRPMATSQDFVNWVCGEELSASYLRYLLMAEQESVRRFAYGTTHQTMYYPDAKALHVLVPDRIEQEAIAEVLGALDDKIAANIKLVGLLDRHMALEYSAAIESDGRTAALADVAEFHNRRRVPLSSRERDERPGDVPYYGASGVFGSVDDAIFDGPLVLVGEDGSVIKDDGTAVVQYIWGPSWVNNHAHVLTGVGISTELLYRAIAGVQVAPLVTGAVQPKINMGNLKRLQLQIPKDEALKRVETVVCAETASKRTLVDECRSLATLRDALLPQLMSGKVRVKKAEKLVAEVA